MGLGEFAFEGEYGFEPGEDETGVGAGGEDDEDNDAGEEGHGAPGGEEMDAHLCEGELVEGGERKDGDAPGEEAGGEGDEGGLGDELPEELVAEASHDLADTYFLAAIEGLRRRHIDEVHTGGGEE